MLSIDPKKIRAAAVIVNAVMIKVALIVGGYYAGREIDLRYASTPYGITAGICLGLALGLWWLLFTTKRFL